jgi:diguanylate cyclase (GGDEF)-like protein
MSSDVLSLKSNIDKLDQQHSQFLHAVTCYAEALSGVENNVLVPCALKTAERPLSLEPERRYLLKSPGSLALDAARKSLSTALESAGDHIRKQLAGTVDLAQVLKTLAETSCALQRRSNERESRFMGVASDLQTAAELESVAELRDQICVQIRHITSLVEDMKLENQQLVAELEQEMQQYRRKLDEVELQANRDTLTGLANRRVLQARIDEQIQSGLPFCLLLMDLNRFKAVNDKYGHLAGDELLKRFAANLRRNLRANDTAARWGGDEFVVVLPCRLPDALARSRLLESALCGTYDLTLPDSTVRVQVGLSSGLAEHHAGESADQLLARADQLLYLTKAHR